MTENTQSRKKFIVVVVEDEDLIRLFICEALADAGFDVVEVQHADDAVQVLRARAPDIHALFTDIHMPGSMDGLALANLSSRTRPWIALLIASRQPRPRSIGRYARRKSISAQTLPS